MPALEGDARARMQAQRALILQRLGRLDEALEGYRRPLSRVPPRGRRAVGGARCCATAACCRSTAARLAPPRPTSLRAEELHESIGQALAATQVRHNLGWVAARRGDVPRRWSCYDRVEAEYRAHDVPLALLLMDRCEVLLSARLAAEARANADAAVAELEAAGIGSDLAEARLLAAHAELLVRRHRRRPRPRRPAPTTPSPASTARAGPRSARAARRAQAAWRRGGRRRRATTRRGRAERAARGRARPRRARRASAALDAAGWGVEALDARLIAGRAALELGRPRLARRQLELAAAARAIAGPCRCARGRGTRRRCCGSRAATGAGRARRSPPGCGRWRRTG